MTGTQTVEDLISLWCGVLAYEQRSQRASRSCPGLLVRDLYTWVSPLWRSVSPKPVSKVGCDAKKNSLVLTFGARKNCSDPCSKSNWTKRGTSLDMFKLTSLANGADLAKLDRYLSENVRDTCFSRMIETPGSESSVVALAFLAGCRSQQSSKTASASGGVTTRGRKGSRKGWGKVEEKGEKERGWAIKKACYEAILEGDGRAGRGMCLVPGSK